MPLENSPKLGAYLQSSFDLRAWIRRHRIALFVMCGVILAFNLGSILFQVALIVTASAPGGLDGCVISADNQPVNATVWVDALSRRTFADGCFFFATLSPGAHTVRVVLDNGSAWTQPIAIQSGRAVGLGALRLPGR